MTRRLQTLPFLGLCLLGCATPVAPARPDPPAPPAPAAPITVSDEPRDGLSVQGGMGQVDQDDVQAEWQRHMPEVNRCYADVLKRLWYLSGEVVVRVRLGETGQVRAATVIKSTVGNYEIERCVATVAQRMQLPAPKGGEAEFQCPVAFPARAPVRQWPEERVAGEITRHKGEIVACAPKLPAQKKPALRLTLYIGPGGRVGSAGLSADEPIDDRLGACVINRTRAWRFDDPLGELVKASYDLD